MCSTRVNLVKRTYMLRRSIGTLTLHYGKIREKIEPILQRFWKENLRVCIEFCRIRKYFANMSANFLHDGAWKLTLFFPLVPQLMVVNKFTLSSRTLYIIHTYYETLQWHGHPITLTLNPSNSLVLRTFGGYYKNITRGWLLSARSCLTVFKLTDSGWVTPDI